MSAAAIPNATKNMYSVTALIHGTNEGRQVVSSFAIIQGYALASRFVPAFEGAQARSSTGRVIRSSST